MTDTNKSSHYVSNAKLYDEFKAFYDKCQVAKERGEERPQPTRYMAECIIKIANKLSNRPNFIGYSYKDEMIADAILACTSACYYINPYKNNVNPFSYLTQTASNAFILRIKKEKKQSKIKAHYIFESVPDDFLSMQAHEDQEYHNSFIEFLRENSAFSDDFSKKKERKKKDAGVDITTLLEVESDGE